MVSRRDVILGAAGLAALTACSSGTKQVAPTPAVFSGRVYDVHSFGAAGDGRTDDTAALRRALAALRAGDTLQLRGGVFRHSQVLVLSTAGVRLAGPGTLQATDEERSAVQIQAVDVAVEGLELSISATTKRWSTPDQHKLVLGEHTGITVKDVTINGSAAAGVFCMGTQHFLLQGLQVSDTRADGIHLTYGSSYGRVESPIVRRSGDDGVAVVSYLQDPAPCRNITVSHPTIRTTTGGRGVSVVGGEDVIYHDIDVDDSFAAAVYIACEGGDSVTRPVRRVQVRNGTTTRANSAANIDHGAVLLYSDRGQGTVADVTVAGLTISGTRAGASRQIGAISEQDGPLANIRFEHLTLSPLPEPYQGNAPVDDITLTDVSAGGAAVTL